MRVRQAGAAALLGTSALAASLGLIVAPAAAQSAAANQGGTARQDASTGPIRDEIVVYARLRAVGTLEIPQTVDVLDDKLITASASETVGDALRFVPGSSRDGSALDAFGDTYLIRGFYANQTVNGITANPLRQARDTIAIERIEVLKGPASVLYGQLQPGAVVNIVTKQPGRTWKGEASLSYGRYDDWRGTIDITGPLAADGDIRFRLTGAYDDSNSFIDFWHRKHAFIAPTIAFDIGEATTATIEAFYTRNTLRGFFNGLPAEGTVLPNPFGPLPRSLSLTDPTFNPSIRENADISARVEHRFSDKLTWRTSLSWTREDVDEEGVFGLLGWDEEFRTLTRAVLASKFTGTNWSANTDLAFDFDTGPFTHALVVGGSYSWFKRSTVSDVALAPSLDVRSPQYSTTVRPTTDPIPSLGSASKESTRNAGLFMQDRISVTDTLKLVAGVRWSHYRQNNVASSGGSPFVPSRQTQTSWTSQFGLLYIPVSNVALFANRTTSFLPVQGTTSTGSPLEPETGTEYEVGAKATLLDGRVLMTAALFHLERGHVAVSDRDSPSSLIEIGAQVAKGVDLSIKAQPIAGLSLYAGYAYTKAKTTEDTNVALVGARIRNIPKHSIVLQGDYEVQQGVLTGLTVGGSATYTGDRSGDLEDSFEVPGYWRVDARADYALNEAITLGVRVENLANKRYYTHAFSLFEVWPGAPRTWKASITTRF